MNPGDRSASGGFLVLQAAALAGLLGWLFSDALAAPLIEHAASAITSLHWEPLGQSYGIARCLGLLLVATTVLGSFLWEGLHWFQRTASPRTIRRLLAVTAIVAVWLAVVVNFDRLAWRAKCHRSTARIAALDALARRLHDDWPRDAGEIEGLGPFTAYPFGRPQLLLLLTPHPLQSTNTVIAAIERSDDGALRFELGGNDGGDWIEWHPVGKRPASFSGGLADQHALERATRLADQWFLVRYGRPEPRATAQSEPIAATR